MMGISLFDGGAKVCHGLFLMVIFSIVQVKAQRMEISGADLPPYSPENLISKVFLGDGVEIVDIQYSGNPSAVGFFDYGNLATGIEKGMLLTTGIATKAAGVGNDGAQDNNDLNQLYKSDKDLEIIAKGAPIRNVARYTIRFIPTADTVRFRYVFASEEYPEFVCSEFNDVFGFFISGPGINGPFENGAINIALIPETNLPVAINNVNGGDIGVWGDILNCTAPNGSLNFSHLFKNNQNSGNQPVFDGYTQVFTAEAVVVPCQVYTIKLAIADVSDEGYDSGVFLEAKSFSTTQLNVYLRTNAPDGALVEGCADGLLTFKLSSPLSSDYVIDYNLFGNAHNGVDYQMLPGSVTIPAGQDSTSLFIRAFEDGLPESSESIFVDVQKDMCNRDTVEIIIRDNQLVPPILTGDTICPAEVANLFGELPLNLPKGKEFSNFTDVPIVPAMAAVYSEITVQGVFPETLNGNIFESVCLDIEHSKPEDLDIFLITPNGDFIHLTSDNGSSGANFEGTCFSPISSQPVVSSLPPFSGSFKPEGSWADIFTSKGPVNGVWRLLIIDDEFGTNGVLKSWTLRFKPPYSVIYNWSPQSVTCVECPSTMTIPLQSTSDYELLVTDVYGCESKDTVPVIVKPAPDSAIINCGTATRSSVRLEWQDQQFANDYEIKINGAVYGTYPNGTNLLTINNLQEGEVVVFEVRTIGDCPGEVSTISCQTLVCQPPILDINNQVNASCHGSQDASVTIQANGNGLFYDFTLGSVTNRTGQFHQLSAGQYEITVSDEIGCNEIIQVNITEPDPLVLIPQIDSDISCFGFSDGRLSVQITGGTSPFEYLWEDQSTLATRDSVPAGTYEVTITDINGCVSVTSVLIDEPEALTVIAKTEKASCFGETDGTATATPFGGTAPYTYRWAGFNNPPTDPTLRGLPAGLYGLTATDSRGCVSQTNFEILQNPAVRISLSAKDASCFGIADGEASAIAGGGTGQFAYLWNNGARTATIDKITFGNYTVTVTDSDGCKAVESIAVGQPAQLTGSAATTGTKCHNTADGSAQLTITGGTSPYAVRWQDGNAGLTRNDLQPGVFTVTVTDAQNCQAILEGTVDSPAPIVVDAAPVHPRCFGDLSGSIEVIANGGAGNFRYTWSHSGLETNSSSVNLPAGTYQVTVSDINNCEENIEINLNDPPVLHADATVNSVSCFGLRDGSINAKGSGGTGNLEYQWLGPANFQSNQAVITNLPAGSYALIIRDANGCIHQSDFEVVEPDLLEGELEVLPVSCLGKRDGQITVFPEGGTEPYQFLVNGKSFGTRQQVSNLNPGVYDIEIRDTRGCSFHSNGQVVRDGSIIELDLGGDTVITFGTELPLIPVIESENPIVTYTWKSADLSSLSCQDCPEPLARPNGQTFYQLIIKDSRGCVAVDGLTVFVKKSNEVFVPTGFTPNDDFSNDRLTVHGRKGSKVKVFQLFDRWGELLFESKDFEVNDENAGWDGSFRGQKMNPGVYVWYLEIEFEDGTATAYKGNTTLIR